jgi:hypothetical protein
MGIMNHITEFSSIKATRFCLNRTVDWHSWFKLSLEFCVGDVWLHDAAVKCTVPAIRRFNLPRNMCLECESRSYTERLTTYPINWLFNKQTNHRNYLINQLFACLHVCTVHQQYQSLYYPNNSLNYINRNFVKTNKCLKYFKKLLQHVSDHTGSIIRELYPVLN